MLLAGLENIHNTADGIGSPGGMKAGKNEMTSLGSSHGSLDGFMVTHFSKKNHIRALAQGSAQGNQIIGSISTDLTLADNAFVMAVQVFQRILKSDDMSFPAMIDLVDDAGHSCGFSASGRTGDQNHAFSEIGSFHNSWWNMQILGIWQVKGNDTDDSSKRTTLAVCIYTESGKSGYCHGEVIVSGFQHRLDVPVMGKLVDDPDKFVCLRGHEPFLKSLQSAELSVDFYRKGTTCNNKNVRGFFLSGKLEKGLYFFFHKTILLYRRTGCYLDSSRQLQRCSRKESWLYCGLSGIQKSLQPDFVYQKMLSHS